MDPVDAAPPAPDACVSCGHALKPESHFCGHCGHRRGDPPVDRAAKVKARIERVRRFESGWGGVRGAILLYVGLLGGQVASYVVLSATDPFAGELASTGIFAAIIVLAVVMQRSTLAHCGGPGFGVKGYGLVVLVSVPIMIVVGLYVRGLSKLFPIHVRSYLEPFEGHGAAWAYLLTAVAPAVFEELAFRGVVFGLLRRSLNPRETILLSAIAFGLLHLSVPMLLTHVPLGIYLGWLRHRSGSLYPSMAAHFLHNALVVTAEVWSLWPGWLST
jgi:uncharacterized protein